MDCATDVVALWGDPATLLVASWKHPRSAARVSLEPSARPQIPHFPSERPDARGCRGGGFADLRRVSSRLVRMRLAWNRWERGGNEGRDRLTHRENALSARGSPHLSRPSLALGWERMRDHSGTDARSRVRRVSEILGSRVTIRWSRRSRLIASSITKRHDPKEMGVVLRQPCVHLELFREFPALRHRTIVIRAGDVGRPRDDTDQVLHRRRRIRNEGVSIPWQIGFHRSLPLHPRTLPWYDDRRGPLHSGRPTASRSGHAASPLLDLVSEEYRVLLDSVGGRRHSHAQRRVMLLPSFQRSAMMSPSCMTLSYRPR